MERQTLPSLDPAPLSYFDPGNGRRIAYRLRAANAKVQGPTILFLPGYASDMEGSKAVEIDRFCGAAGLAYLRLDYSGTGSSGGDFSEGTLDRWLVEVLGAIDLLTDGPVLVVGSSMGGWLALHAALKRPERVKGVVTIAGAPNFTDWGFTPEEKDVIWNEGKLERPNPYGPEPSVTHRAFWKSGEAMRLLYQPILIDCPVRLIHGDKDEEVPIGVAFKTLEDVHSGDVQLTIIKWGKHRLSEPHELETIVREILVLAEKIS
jgi:pimeloyl-ACP methyl ester carboxylesterase